MIPKPASWSNFQIVVYRNKNREKFDRFIAWEGISSKAGWNYRLVSYWIRRFYHFVRVFHPESNQCWLDLYPRRGRTSASIGLDGVSNWTLDMEVWWNFKLTISLRHIHCLHRLNTCICCFIQDNQGDSSQSISISGMVDSCMLDIEYSRCIQVIQTDKFQKNHRVSFQSSAFNLSSSGGSRISSWCVNSSLVDLWINFPIDHTNSR